MQSNLAEITVHLTDSLHSTRMEDQGASRKHDDISSDEESSTNHDSPMKPLHMFDDSTDFELQESQKKCNWCNQKCSLMKGKKFCQKCKDRCEKECTRCHRPYPDAKKYFTKDPTLKRCDSCEKKYQAEKLRRQKQKVKKASEIVESDDDQQPRRKREKITEDLGPAPKRSQNEKTSLDRQLTTSKWICLPYYLINSEDLQKFHSKK